MTPQKPMPDCTRPAAALTFDDGPNTTTTVAVLNLLERYDIPATFFLIGDNITDGTVPIVLKAQAIGCEFANHSRSHRDMTTLPLGQVKDEIAYTSEKIFSITGETPKFFRPPYLAVNDMLYKAAGLPFIGGTGVLDWKSEYDAVYRAGRLLTEAEDGRIILLHDFTGNEMTVEALETALPALLSKGIQFVTLTQLFAVKGTAPPYGQIINEVL